MMEERSQQSPSAPPIATRPGGNGRRPGIAPEAGTKTPGRQFPRKLLLPLLFVLVIAAAVVGYRYWEAAEYYVSTDNAQVAGNLVQIGSMNAGRVDSLTVDVGDKVEQNQVIGTILLPTTLSVSQSGTPVLGFIGSENQRAEIKASVSGIVVARQANVGDTVAVGQPIVTVVDPSKLWIQAQIKETDIDRVKVGQPVDVSVDSLGKTLPGRVIAVSQASAATFSLLPASNASGNFTKVTQLVPVKISVDYGNLPLVLGSSVEVSIRVRE
jgi:multidrug resistance efflux pump